MNVSPVLSSTSAASVEQLSTVTETARAKKVAFNAAALKNASEPEQRAAVAGQFEAILVRQLLGKTMSSMLGGEGGVAGSIYGDMLTDTISQQLTAGPGLGMGRFIEQQLAPRGVRVAASEAAAVTTSPASLGAQAANATDQKQP